MVFDMNAMCSRGNGFVNKLKLARLKGWHETRPAHQGPTAPPPALVLNGLHRLRPKGV